MKGRVISMDRRELMQNMQVGRSQLEAALFGLSDQQLLAAELDNGWSGKDLLAHLAFWEKRVGDIYLGLVMGDIAGLEGASLSVDALNARALEQNRLMSLAQVRENESWAYQALRRLAAAAPEKHLFDPQCFTWTGGRPFVEWIVDNTYAHYDEHLPALLAWRDRHRE